MSVVAAELIARLTADTEPAERDLKNFSQKVQSGAGGVFKGNIMSSAVQSLGRGLVDIGKIGVGVFTDMIAQGADFSAQMDGVTAVLGGTQAQGEALSNLAIDLAVNPNLKVNATEAANAIENLATAGLNAEQILGGAAEATVLLANSTGGDFGQAATVATDVMALFNVSAEDMMDAVDGIAGVSNVSKFDLNDYANAISQAGGVAALSGVSLEDFNATIAATAPYFSSGSDAGTSFKTFLQRLNPTTAEAKDLMHELNLLTEDGTSIFYDSTGSLKDMEAVIEIMNETFGDMTESQKSFYLGQLFGTDAMRTAGAVADMTWDSFVNLKQEMADTSALDAAKKRTDNFKSAWENVQGAIDAVKISMWQGLEGAAQELAVAISPVIEWVAPIAVDYAKQLGDWISDQVANVKATANVVWDVTEGDIASTIMTSLGRLTGADMKIDAQAQVVKVDWGFFTYTYDAKAHVYEADFGDAHYTFDAEANVSTLTFAGKTISGEGAHPLQLAVQLAATELPGAAGSVGSKWIYKALGDPSEGGASLRQWLLDAAGTESFSDAEFFPGLGDAMARTLDQAAADMSARTEEIKAQMQETFSTAWTATIQVGEVVWGVFTHVYDVVAQVGLALWGTYTHTYPVLAEIQEVLWGVWTHTYDAIANIFKWNNSVGEVTIPAVADVRRVSGGNAPSEYYTGERAEPSTPARRRATGEPMTQGGYTWVGERGPELVRLPKTSRIYSNEDSMAMMGGSVTVNNYNTLSQPHDIELLAQRVAAQIRRKA